MSNDDERDEMEEEIDKFLAANFPQIKMHGGSYTIKEADPEDGYVSVHLGGACSGCGISPMTKQAIQDRLPKKVDDVEMVKVETGGSEMGGLDSTGTGMDDNPF